MKNNNLRRIPLLLIFFTFLLSLESLAQNGVGIIDYTDPAYPEPMIGKRSFSVDLKRSNNDGRITKAVLHHSKFSSDLTDNPLIRDARELPSISRRRNSIGAEINTLSIPDGTVRINAMLPWEKPTHREIEAAKPKDEYEPGTKVYYVWEITRTPIRVGEPQNFFTEIKSFTMPRRITLAILGDSYGSGEGAPDLNGSSPWIEELEGVIAHRSAISGQELAVKEFFEARPDFAYDYINVSCSGAVISSINERKSEYMKEADDGFIQAKKLAQWLSARKYTDLDTIVLLSLIHI